MTSGSRTRQQGFIRFMVKRVLTKLFTPRPGMPLYERCFTGIIQLYHASASGYQPHLSLFLKNECRPRKQNNKHGYLTCAKHNVPTAYRLVTAAHSQFHTCITHIRCHHHFYTNEAQANAYIHHHAQKINIYKSKLTGWQRSVTISPI